MILLCYTLAVASCSAVLTHSSNGSAFCHRVIDGDTIKIEWSGGIESVRIQGIEAPETRRGKRLKVTSRLQAYIEIDGSDVARILLSESHVFLADYKKYGKQPTI
jgi:hypothetical protein